MFQSDGISDGTSEVCFDGVMDRFVDFGPIILGFRVSAMNHIDVT